MTKIACAMIVKGDGDEPKNLDRALSTITPFVDGVFITLTGQKDTLAEAEAVCKKHGVHVSYGRFQKKIDKETVDWVSEFVGGGQAVKEGEEIFMFDEARNYSFSQVPKEYDWILWMDCDDVLQKGENLKPLAQVGMEQGIECFYFEYWYQVEQDDKGMVSHVILKHLRERLVRNIGVFKWIAPIHETLIEQRPTRKTDSYDVVIVHLANDADRQVSIHRNLSNLEYLIYTQKGKDPRPVYYLAKAYFDLNTPEHNEKSIKLIQHYLWGENPSGWAEERGQACEYLAEIYRRKGELNNAIKACMNGLIEYEQSPSLYVQLAIAYMHKFEYERSLFWLRLSQTFPKPKTTLVDNPKEYEGRILEVMYNASLNLGKIDEAYAAAEKLSHLYPNDTTMAQTMQFITSLRAERDITQRVVQLADALKATGERPKIKALLNAVPKAIENNPFIQKLYQDNIPPAHRDEKDIVIYCGPGFTNWSPQLMKNPKQTFVGGSEEAVIRMSSELARQGWKVTVYGDPGADEGEYEGVLWLPYYKFNRNDHFNILISWRDIRFFDGDFNAKLAYLWCHDIQNPHEFTDERLAKIHKVFFLSKWHRDNVPTLQDSKILLTTNGI